MSCKLMYYKVRIWTLCQPQGRHKPLGGPLALVKLTIRKAALLTDLQKQLMLLVTAPHL